MLYTLEGVEATFNLIIYIQDKRFSWLSINKIVSVRETAFCSSKGSGNFFINFNKSCYASNKVGKYTTYYYIVIRTTT